MTKDQEIVVQTNSSGVHRSRAWFQSRLRDYAVHSDLDAVYGQLVRGAAASGFGAEAAQVVAWQGTLPAFQGIAQELLDRRPDLGQAGLYIEYEIPRRAKRIDAVLVTQDTVVVIEFKTSIDQLGRASLWQAEDYAMDLRDFHQGSRDKQIHVVVVAAGSVGVGKRVGDESIPVYACTPDYLVGLIDE